MFGFLKPRHYGIAALSLYGCYKLSHQSSLTKRYPCLDLSRSKALPQSMRFPSEFFTTRFINLGKGVTTECEESKSKTLGEFKLSDLRDKYKNWKKKREEKKIVRDEEYPNKIRIMMSEIMIMGLGCTDSKMLCKKQEEMQDSLESIKFQKKLGQCYKELVFLLKGITYDDSIEKLAAVMESSDEDLDHFFLNIKLFLEGAHKEFVKIAEKYKDEMPSKLHKQICYTDEEVYRFLSSLSEFYTENELKERISTWDYFESHLKEFAESPATSLKRSYALKYFHNKSERAKLDANPNYSPQFFEGPYIAPMNLDQGDFDILLLHGNASHCIKCWSILDTEDQHDPDIWIRSNLIKDLKKAGKEPRVIHGTYETFQQIHEYTSKNIPELDLFELGEKLKEALAKIGVGKRPLIILGYSMGGILCKTLLNISPEIAENTKGIIFFACPHFGSDVRDDTHQQLGEIISGMNRFMNQNCIDDEEFVTTVLDNLKISKPAHFLISPDRKANLSVINNKFNKYGINCMSIIEGKKVYFPKTDHHYYVVKPESAYWPGSIKLTMDNKNHFQITRMSENNSELDDCYKTIFKFIKNNL
ncbi:unnamed protein product [Moneuplotes crassus]|uniref:Uncharacterized protein n=1 Tax=Euplotes crassus TaxID=5936 RepID=A0AAD1U424_EUPCR|nr:unnamed protein product [Moneuplotes crassus]